MALSGIYPMVNTGARYEETSTTALFKPGDISIDNQGGIWVYGKASATLTVYSLCTISSAATPIVTMATTTTIVSSPYTTGTPGYLGINQIAAAANDYLWIWRGPGGGVGRGIKCNLAASCAAEVQLYTTATNGVVDDANVDESMITGLKSVAAVTSAAAEEVVATMSLTVNIGEPD